MKTLGLFKLCVSKHLVEFHNFTDESAEIIVEFLIEEDEFFMHFDPYNLSVEIAEEPYGEDKYEFRKERSIEIIESIFGKKQK